MATLKMRKALLASTAVPRRRRAISLIRFSTPQQALGDSARRQYERAVAYCEANNLELVETIRDEGKSGLHGIHRKKGAFGRFVRRFLRGEIHVDVFIAEAFDRFTREPVRIAQQLFLSLINGDPERGIHGLEVVTLIDGKRYSADSIDQNVGELFTSIGLMLGAHMESRNKGDRIGETWNAPITGRRNGGIGKETGLPSNVFPAWIIKMPNGPKLDKAKAKTLHRIRKMLPTMGLEQIAKRLNDEGVAPLNCRKRPGRDTPLWDKNTIQRIVRGRQVLGEQAVGRYMDVKDPESGEVTFKRVLTGEVTKDAYPAVFTEHEWLAANHCLDSRRRGTQVGRNVVSYANLFGDLAVCGVCGGRMKIRGKGRLGPFKYFGCSNAALHKKRKSGEPVSKIIPVCDNTQYYRLDKIEADILPRVADEVVDDSPQDDDPAETLTKRIAKMKAEAAQIERDYMASMRRTGHLAEMTQAKLERDHAGKLTAIGKVERELAAHHAAKPMGELQETVRTVLARALVGDVAARAKIAESLPGLLGTVTCRSDGKWDWISKSGVIQCGGEPVMWASRSFKMKA